MLPTLVSFWVLMMSSAMAASALGESPVVPHSKARVVSAKRLFRRLNLPLI